MPTVDPPVKVPHTEQGPTEKKLPPWPVDDDVVTRARIVTWLRGLSADLGGKYDPSIDHVWPASHEEWIAAAIERGDYLRGTSD